jgi:hypothetical protein
MIWPCRVILFVGERMQKTLKITGFLCLLILAVSGISSAATYKYEDKHGNVCFADDLQAIPEPYRKTAVLIEGEAKEEKPAQPGRYTGRDPIAEKMAEKAAENNTAEKPSVPASSVAVAKDAQARPTGMAFSIRLAISFGVIFAAIAILGVVNKLPAMKDNRYGKVVARSSFVMIVVVYLLVAHAKDLMLMFGLAGKTLNTVQNEAAEKGRKTGEAIKKLDALIDELNKEEEMSRKEQATAQDDRQ